MVQISSNLGGHKTYLLARNLFSVVKTGRGASLGWLCSSWLPVPCIAQKNEDHDVGSWMCDAARPEDIFDHFRVVEAITN